MTKEHRAFVANHKDHKPPGGGCIIYCSGKYEIGNPHSHRWNAGKQAKAEKRVPYNDYDLWASRKINIDGWKPSSVKRLSGEGGFVGTPTATTGKVKPFYRSFHPFNHNAHHILPTSSIEKCINLVVARAAKNQGNMQNLVVGGILTEPYNNNDKPNMIVLPTRRSDARRLGLPLHTDGSCDHPQYRDMIDAQLQAAFPPKYDSMANEVAAAVHNANISAPAIKGMLVPLSEAMYEAIIATAVARQHLGESLDSIKDELNALSQA